MENLGNRVPATGAGAVAGLFKDETKAVKAIQDLRSAGFSELSKREKWPLMVRGSDDNQEVCHGYSGKARASNCKS